VWRFCLDSETYHPFKRTLATWNDIESVNVVYVI